MKLILQIAAITGICALGYAGLRSIPQVNCSFLHYQAPEVTADGLEFCGSEGPMFLDLTQLRFSVTLALATDGTPEAGKESLFSLRLTTPSGKLLLPHDLVVTHTERLHVLIVDPSLGDYHHIHPEPVGLTGEWQFSFTPKHGGTYRLFAEMVPVRTPRTVIATGEIDVAGAPRAAHLDVVSKQRIGEYRFELNSTGGDLRVNQENGLTLRVYREGSDDPVELQAVMGSLAHVVAFDEQLNGFAHLHPKFTGRERNPVPELAFAFNTNQPGAYRLWTQVKLDGQEIFAPFDLKVN